MEDQIKYETLVGLLDKLSSEAPVEYKSYHPASTDLDNLNKARAKSFIHLFLKVKCNQTSFKERFAHLTDETGDGGIDAYYFDEENKVLLLIQSKFRIDSSNFKTKSITADEIIKMEIVDILKGIEIEKYNDKIKALHKKWKAIHDHANWIYKVIFLGNITRYTDTQIKKLIDDASYEIFNFDRTYNELVFPLCSGTFFDPKEIKITITLNDDGANVLKRKIPTKYGDFEVRVLFVPTKEIGKILSKYKNSILKFNPRNYLSLSQNKVNQGIRNSILNSTSNEFALLNNGITLLANSFKISETTGEENIGQVIMTNPQIINGGQTAYTLSKIWDEDMHHNIRLFDTKEVMLKIIILKDYEKVDMKLIEELSNSTNQQSRVEEADRRSNEKVQYEIQRKVYEDFGFYYERKKGEFYYGINGGYINKNLIIDRYNFLRAYLAYCGQPRWARQKGSEVLFRKNSFDDLFNSSVNYMEMYFAYRILLKLNEINNKNWGSGLRYGKMAIIAAISRMIDKQKLNKSNIDITVEEEINNLEGKWTSFETWFMAKQANQDVYGGENFDIDNYYKGKTIDNDIKEYFNK
ncbi:MAG: AIPR family protein [Bacteroidetes bacterium]|nr:AIPR family protein [Bacteroidota bacterium]